ncbi:4355_t:CDS:2, partial [Cetraspora pellucida]
HWMVKNDIFKLINAYYDISQYEPIIAFALKCRVYVYYTLDKHEESLADLSTILDIEESLVGLNQLLKIIPNDDYTLKCRDEI